MELGSVIGFIAGTFFIIASIFISADFKIELFMKMVDAASVMIVFGGTFASVVIAHPLSKVIAGFKSFGKIFKDTPMDPSEAISEIIKLANLARKEGLLALDEASNEIDNDFMRKGIMLIVDGTDPELVRNILETELVYQDSRHAQTRGLWEFIGTIAPAWGMIGTLIGLIMMLQDISNPDTIGPNMAVAVLTTFYGSVVANFIAIPTAKKMKLFSDEELLMKEVLIEGMLSIQAGENPRIIEEKLKAFLSPVYRNQMEDDEIENGGGS